jgi:hypothetical protein
MPPYLYVGRCADLLQRFLDLVLAEVALARGPCRADVIGAEGLGTAIRRMSEGSRPARRAAASIPGPDGLEVGPDGLHVERGYLM